MSTEELLEQVNLRYSSDKKPGYTRKVHGNSFDYFDFSGQRITDIKTIERINGLAIPPAYTNVWICPYKNGHLQAVGYDAKKRKQYRYHPLWNQISQESKFEHLIAFANQLPIIRKQIQQDLSTSGLPRKKVIAAIVWLLENTLIRVGNEEYEKENKSYGLTTLKNKHATIVDTQNIIFQFKGKSGVYHKVKFSNKKIAAIIRQCKELPGQDLFEYVDADGKIESISSYDVNEYLKELTSADVTAKDFRTWAGSLLAAVMFDKLGIPEDEKTIKENIVETIKNVASHLRNKPNTSKKYYIHPLVVQAYYQGYILSNILEISKVSFEEISGLHKQENNMIFLLEFMTKKAN